MNILFLSRWFPFPPSNGSKIRIYNLLQALSQQHDVTLLSFNERRMPPQGFDQQAFCSEIKIVPWKPFNKRSTKSLLGLFSSSPRSLVDTYSSEMDSMIRTELKRRKIDLVIASQLSMASYYPSFQNVPALFEEIELGLIHQQLAVQRNSLKRFWSRLNWLKLKRYLSPLLDAFNGGTVVSAEEYRVFADNFQGRKNKIEILPNSINLDDFQNLEYFRKPNQVIFSGSFSYPPNYHGILWFIRDVFPLVLRQIPDTQLVITGDHAGLPITETKNITLTGYVDDIKSLIASSDVSIAPLWFGGGTRLKILEAMAIGTPVVSTSKGSEGLNVRNGEHILIADEPEDFAWHVIHILTSTELRHTLSSNASQLVKQQYDWKLIAPTFLDLVQRAAAGGV